MARESYYQIRLSDTEKTEAFAVFRELGITPAQAFRLFLNQVVRTRSIPFPVTQANPHEVASKALLLQQLEATTGQKLERFPTREEAVAALDAWFSEEGQLIGGRGEVGMDEINEEVRQHRSSRKTH